MVGITASLEFVFRCIETVPQLFLTPNDLTQLRLLIVVPAYKTLQRIKFVSPLFVQVEPFLKFTSSAGDLCLWLCVLSHIVTDASERCRLDLLFCVSRDSRTRCRYRIVTL